MFILIIAVFIIGLGLYFVTGMSFEMGDGFAEMKKKARDVNYRVVDKRGDKKC